MRSIINTYVAMADDNSVAIGQLGASPAELEFNVESTREINFVDHSGCPEMDLSQVIDLS